MSKWSSFKKFLKEYDYNWKFKLLVCLPLFSALVAIDWITKGIVVSTMTFGEKKQMWPGFLNLHYTINPGAAYGMNANNLALAVSIATIVTILMSLFFVFINDRVWLVGITILLSGSWANLLGRAWAPTIPATSGYPAIVGGVVDFLVWDFSFLGSSNYIFNIADLWVNISVVYLIVVALPFTIVKYVKEAKAAKNIEADFDGRELLKQKLPENPDPKNKPTLKEKEGDLKNKTKKSKEG
ncbi:lipoprotein signal peptidase [Spiroplasma sabaudiense Ar-1343]|uniref:Lipoprotein signal peptidase n=1 Tax=Spiroplasma sabaudiense Ar-1343 TaxID=1276257 RepID=W6A9Z3_9MOLU|nr:signal peptidase II [Spiroplasma sabaudiense]AHI53998.1 lipoprotein signal peptidase [Spiroplasma sabaudiense Ar-1343]